ncbi:MAG: CBS domain-containing protein [Aquificae bacterium]|nr:CBS domain-containing protein [Aquificota bacterium]
MVRKYLFLPLLIGFLSGICGILFTEILNLTTHLVLEKLIGYYQPLPSGEGSRDFFTPQPQRAYLLPLAVGLAGLVSGLLSRYLVSDPSFGTDSAIRAYHTGREVPLRDALVKLLSSALTIGSGGTAGKWGPMALAGAGIGSFVGRLLNLPKAQRREALAVGLGAGVAAVFKAPLAGAFLSAEIFFKRDFYVETMIPSFIASLISYSVYGSVYGFEPVFSAKIPPFHETSPLSLLAYAGLGLLCALVTRLYVSTFRRAGALFRSLPLPGALKPALGGALAGAVGALIPPAIGSGYGWLQLTLDGKINDYTFTLLALLGVLVGVSLTIGSGGSGGVFGPSVMIGGFAGASYALFLNERFSLSLDVPSFTIVGMVALFAGAAKAPLSTLILVAEMTGGYELLVPALIAVFITYFLSGEGSIFPSQVDTRFDSPVHMRQMGVYVLEKLKVRDYMSRELITTNPEATLSEVEKVLEERGVGGLPVVEKGQLVGIITRSDVLRVPHALRASVKVKEVMRREIVVLEGEESLATALRLISTREIGRLPVVSDRRSMKLIGIITRADIGRALKEWKEDEYG